VQRIRLKDKVSKTDLDKLHRQWLDEDTALPYVEWLYIKHNIFGFDTHHKSKIDIYNRYTISDPKNKNYQHFCKWLENNGEWFECPMTGRTLGDINKLYDAEKSGKTPPKTKKAAKATDRIEIKRYEDLTYGDQALLAYAYENTDRELGLYDWMLVYHKTASKQTGAYYVDEYNESTFSDPNDENFMVFPQWLHEVKNRQRENVSAKRMSFVSLIPLCREVWGQTQVHENVEDETLDRFMGGTMSLDDVKMHILRIEKELSEQQTPHLAVQLKIALKYRDTLLARHDGVYQQISIGV